MTVEQILKYYGDWGKGMRALGMGVTTLQRWILLGYIPIQTQYRIEVIAKTSKLKARVKDCQAQFDKYRVSDVNE